MMNGEEYFRLECDVRESHRASKMKSELERGYILSERKDFGRTLVIAYTGIDAVERGVNSD